MWYRVAPCHQRGPFRVAFMFLLAARQHCAYPDLNSLPNGRRLDPVSPYVELILVVMLPTALGYGLIFSFRGFRWAYERWPRSPAPDPEPMERLTAALRRLRAELETMETRPGIPNKHVRVSALRGAYLDALGTACRRLEVTPPRGADAQRFDQADVYRVESELRQRGLDVREPVTR
jgi:hypothetical protein